MKLYSLVNNYLEGIRAGIQALHSSTKLITKYYDDSEFGTKCVNMISDWDQNHETVAIVYGGGHDNLLAIYSLLEELEEVPVSVFKEPGLNDTITSVSVLCSTQMVYDMDDYRKKIVSDEEILQKYGDYFGSVLIKIAKARSVQ